MKIKVSQRILKAHATEKRGTALVMVATVIVSMSALSLAFLTLTTSAYKENRQAKEGIGAFYVTEAALNEAYATYQESGKAGLSSTVYPRNFENDPYWVDITWGDEEPGMDDDLVRLVATAVAGTERTSAEMMIRTGGGVGGDAVNWGIFGKDGIELYSNALMDSYDSTLGTYDSQITGSHEGTPYANTGGQVASNGDIILDSNAGIIGDATPGPGSNVSLSGNTVVTGTTLPALEDVTLPPFSVPSFPPSGSINESSGTRNLPSGEYNFSGLDLDSNAILNITGPATIVVSDFTLSSNANLVADTTNGPVIFYVTGQFSMNSNATARPVNDEPKDLSFFIEGHSPDIALDSNFELTGTIYAPDRRLNALSNGRIWGAVVARELALDSNTRFHFDESLLGVAVMGETGGGVPVVISWRPTATELMSGIPANFDNQAN